MRQNITTTLSLIQENCIKKVVTNLSLWTNNSQTMSMKASQDTQNRKYNKLHRQKDSVILFFQ